MRMLLIDIYLQEYWQSKLIQILAYVRHFVRVNVGYVGRRIKTSL